MNKQNQTKELTAEKVVVATDPVMSCDLSGEEALLNLDSGIYYGLNGVGSAVWRHIRRPAQIGDIVDSMTAEYEVERERCERDVTALLQKLIANGMARIVD